MKNKNYLYLYFSFSILLIPNYAFSQVNCTAAEAYIMNAQVSLLNNSTGIYFLTVKTKTDTVQRKKLLLIK